MRGGGSLEVQVPRGVVLAKGSYTLQSDALSEPLRAHFDGDGWAAKDGAGNG